MAKHRLCRTGSVLMALVMVCAMFGPFMMFYRMHTSAESQLVPGTAWSAADLARQVIAEAPADGWAALSGGYAPWNAQLYHNGEWKSIARVSFPFAGAYATVAEGEDRGHQVGVEETAGLFRLSPYGNWEQHLGKSTAALTFTVPAAGRYTFGADDIDTPDAQNFTNYKNKEFDRPDGSKAGVRITKNGETVWPQTGREAA